MNLSERMVHGERNRGIAANIICVEFCYRRQSPQLSLFVLVFVPILIRNLLLLGFFVFHELQIVHVNILNLFWI